MLYESRRAVWWVTLGDGVSVWQHKPTAARQPDGTSFPPTHPRGVPHWGLTVTNDPTVPVTLAEGGGNYLRYFGDWSSELANVEESKWLYSLLKHRDGRCGAWSVFFKRVGRAAGVKMAAPGDRNGLGTLVVLPPAANGGIVVKTNQAQGGNASTKRFKNHEICYAPGVIFDPSYGRKAYPADGDPITIVSMAKAWERECVRGWEDAAGVETADDPQVAEGRYQDDFDME
jgi:hypothetical protein